LGLVLRNQSSSTVIVWTTLIAVLAGISSAFLYQTFTQQPSSVSSSNLPYLGETGLFKLTTSDGREFDQNELKGKVWVADFIFTRCLGQCPFMVEKTKELQKSFLDFQDLRFVSISVDPQNDTPEVLKAYKEKHEIVSDQWLFLTSDKKTIYDLVKSRFKLGVEEGGDIKEPIIHSNRFVLVDRQGMIRGYYSAASPEDFEALQRDLAMLLQGNS
jgi:protein SCO1/2